MKLEQQVINLELAKKLKELGIKQSSIFAWEKMCGKKNWNLMYGSLDDIHPVDWDSYAKTYHAESVIVSAFTVAELGEVLPNNLYVKKVPYWLQFEIKNSQGGWSCQYRNMGRETLKFFEEETMVNSGAKMLCYLIEKGLLKPNP